MTKSMVFFLAKGGLGAIGWLIPASAILAFPFFFAKSMYKFPCFYVSKKHRLIDHVITRN